MEMGSKIGTLAAERHLH